MTRAFTIENNGNPLEATICHLDPPGDATPRMPGQNLHWAQSTPLHTLVFTLSLPAQKKERPIPATYLFHAGLSQLNQVVISGADSTSFLLEHTLRQNYATRKYFWQSERLVCSRVTCSCDTGTQIGCRLSTLALGHSAGRRCAIN